MKVATEKNRGGKTTKRKAYSFFNIYKGKSASTKDSVGGKPESNSTSPSVSVLAKSGKPGSVSFATTTGRNETEINRLKPTAKEKTGETDISSSAAKEIEGGKKQKINSKESRAANCTNTSCSNKNTTKTGGKASTQSTPCSTTPKISRSSSFAAAAGQDPISQDRELQGSTAVVSIIVKVNKGEDPKKKFIDKIVKGLAFLHGEGEDPQVAVLLINHVGVVTTGTKRIKKKSNFPTSIIGFRKFLSISSDLAFNKVNNATGRSVKCSARSFFSSNPKKLLDGAGANLRNLGVGMYHKEL
jgi:hypothetical protein